jgi:hypothetical protein
MNLSRQAELARETEVLARADWHIAQGRDRIARQRELVEALHQEGRSAPEAEELLTTLMQTMRTWLDHREAIVQRIAYLEGRAPADGRGLSVSSD